MTRINAKIQPRHLCDQHLVAEYREIVRIPNVVRANPERARKTKRPDHFVLGTGHVVFFYDKLRFLHYRFLELCTVMRERKFAVNMTDEMFHNLPEDLYNDWRPVLTHFDEANRIVCQRICEKVQNMKEVRVNGEKVNNIDYAHGLLKHYVAY